MQSLDNYASKTLAEIKDRHFHRTLNEAVREEGFDRDKRRLPSFTCNGYLNLTQHLAVKWIAISSIKKYGVGFGVSRQVARTRVLAR